MEGDSGALKMHMAYTASYGRREGRYGFRPGYTYQDNKMKREARSREVVSKQAGMLMKGKEDISCQCFGIYVPGFLYIQ